MVMDANELFQTATYVLPDGPIEARQQEWKAHPTFPGVWMKHLMLGKDTAGALSCHLVRIEEGCSIGSHVHEGSMELHEVFSGEGVCRMEGREVAYAPGTCMVIAVGAEHSVEARRGELQLMARFAPALA
jgi:mannose-6-phosphate isomerase-like protein (cupin superfamily)